MSEQNPDELLERLRDTGERLSGELREAIVEAGSVDEHREAVIDGLVEVMQDASLQESMGPIVDRTKENLVSTDNGIIMARHRLRKAVTAFRDKGAMPPGRDTEHQKVRSAARVLPPDQPFKEAMREDLTARPGVKQTSV